MIGRIGHFLKNLPKPVQKKVRPLIEEDFDKLELFLALECVVGEQGEITFKSLDASFEWDDVYSSAKKLLDGQTRCLLDDAWLANETIKQILFGYTGLKFNVEKNQLICLPFDKPIGGFSMYVDEYFLKEHLLNPKALKKRVNVYQEQINKPANRKLVKEFEFRKIFDPEKQESKKDQFLIFLAKKKRTDIEQVIVLINKETERTLERIRKEIEKALMEAKNQPEKKTFTRRLKQFTN